MQPVAQAGTGSHNNALVVRSLARVGQGVMNHRVPSRMGNHSPPPSEIKRKLVGSQKSSKTFSLSDSLSVDSVISEVTLDAAFEMPSPEKNGQCSDAKFFNNVVVASGVGTTASSTRRQQQVFAHQESVSKLDGSDFFKGKFKSAFRKDLSIQIYQEETDRRTEALNNVLEEKKKATEKANLERQISNARLDDLPPNSLLNMFASMHLASDGAAQQAKRERNSPERPQHRRRSSHASSTKRDREKAGQDIVFDPQPDDQDHSSKPSASSQGIATASSAATTGYVPPPRIEDLEAKFREKPSNMEASEIAFNPKGLPDIVESENAESKTVQNDAKPKRRRSSKRSRRQSSDTSATGDSRKASVAKATSKETTPHGSQAGKPPVKEIPKDIPECITIGEDHEFEVSGLMDIPEDLEEFTERSKESKHSRRPHSSHRPRRSHEKRRGSLASTTMSESATSTRKSKASTKVEGSSTNLSESRKTRSESKRSSRSHSVPSSPRRLSSKSGKAKEGKEEKSRRSPKSGTESKRRRSQSLGSERVTKVPCDEDDVSESYRDVANNEGQRRADTPTEEQHPYVDLQEEPSLPRPPDLRRTSSSPDNGSSPSLRSPNSSNDSVRSPVAADEFDAPVLSAAAMPVRALWKRLGERSTSQRMGRRHTLGEDELQTPGRTSQIDSPGSERSHRSPWSRRFSSPVKPKRKSQNGSSSSSSGSDWSLGSHLRSHPSPGLSSGGSSDRSLQSRNPPSFAARPPRPAPSSDIHELPEDAQYTKSDAGAIAQGVSSKSRSRYTPTVVHGATEKLSYSDMFMQGKIGMSGGHRSVLKPTPEGSSVSEF